MRKFLIAAALPMLVGCADRAVTHRSETTPVSQTAQPAPQTFALGSDLSRDGAVPQDAAGEAFTRGAEIFLSVDVNGASTDQNIEVEWLDPRGHVLRSERRVVPEGTRYAPFSSGRTEGWRRGTHRAVVVIDGRKVTDLEFALM